MQKFNVSFCVDVLKILAHNKGKAYSLEELTKTIFTTFTHNNNLFEALSITRENQAKLLDALIDLDNKELIVLNSSTDESYITRKGLLELTGKLYLKDNNLN